MPAGVTCGMYDSSRPTWSLLRHSNNTRPVATSTSCTIPVTRRDTAGGCDLAVDGDERSALRREQQLVQVTVAPAPGLHRGDLVIRRIEDDPASTLGAEDSALVPRQHGAALDCCMRMSIAVVEPSGRNHTGSPLSSTTSGPEWLWLFGVDL